MGTITSTEFSKAFDLDPQKVRRWSRDLFGIDRNALRASGKARVYTTEQALLLYIGGLLIADRGLSIPDTKQVLKHLKPWLEKMGYFPLENWRHEEREKVNVENMMLTFLGWTLNISVYSEGDICLQLTGETVNPFDGSKRPGYKGEYEGFPIYEKTVIIGQIKSDCYSDLKYTINFALDVHIKEFKFLLGV